LPFEDDHLRFLEIHGAIQAIEQFVQGMTAESYAQDERTQAAVERKLMIISEAAIRLKGSAEILCPGVPWRDIRGIGNWLRHAYDRIDAETIWNTIQDDLPQLKSAVGSALKAAEHG
jgi:uncharacterized protein with HEPN domain